MLTAAGHHQSVSGGSACPFVRVTDFSPAVLDVPPYSNGDMVACMVCRRWRRKPGGASASLYKEPRHCRPDRIG